MALQRPTRHPNDPVSAVMGGVSQFRSKPMYKHTLKTAVISSSLMFTAAGTASALDHVSFDMVSANACLPDASAKVRIETAGTAEEMFIFASGLPPKTDFDLFVIQVPKAPFGMSWYQGDLHTDRNG